MRPLERHRTSLPYKTLRQDLANHNFLSATHSPSSVPVISAARVMFSIVIFACEPFDVNIRNAVIQRPRAALHGARTI